MRVICSVDQIEVTNGNGDDFKRINVLDYAPFTDKRYFDKGRQMDAFMSLVDRMTHSIDQLEESIRSGGVAGEGDNW